VEALWLQVTDTLRSKRLILEILMRNKVFNNDQLALKASLLVSP